MVTKSGDCVLASPCMSTTQPFTPTTLIQKIWQHNCCKHTSCGTLLCFLNCSLDMHYTRVILNHTNRSYFPIQHNHCALWICSLVWWPKPLILLDTGMVLAVTGSSHRDNVLDKRPCPLKHYVLVVGHIVFFLRANIFKQTSVHILSSVGLPQQSLSYCYTYVYSLCLVQLFLESCYLFFWDFILS